MKSIVGFHGQLGSGKDLAAERLARMIKLPHTRVAFADKLKQSAAALIDVPVEWLEENKNNPEAKIVVIDGYRSVPNGAYLGLEEPNVIRDFTVRQYLQRYGTEAHRDVFDYDFWVEQAFADTEEGLITATDVRFENEVAAILARGGTVIQILGEKQEEASHASEKPLDGFCSFVIDNSIRDDNFKNLDTELRRISMLLNLPLER